MSTSTPTHAAKGSVAWGLPVGLLVFAAACLGAALFGKTHEDLYTKDINLILQGPYFIALVFGLVGGLMLWTRIANAADWAPGEEEGSSLWDDALKRLKKNRMAVFCTLLFLFIFLWCFLGPTIAYWIDDRLTQFRLDLTAKKAAPSLLHWFGTDELGRDLMLRTMTGGQIAILVGVSATSVALVIGVIYGAVAAYVGGKVDEVMMRFVDMLYAFPRVIFIIVVMAALDTKNIVVLFALIGAISWLTMARIVRGQVLSLRKQEFVEAAHALGLGSPRIIGRHIIPNVLNVVLVYSTLSLPSVMLTEAFLSFIGLGVQAPMASWGSLVVEGQQHIMYTPLLLVFPGVIMAATIFSLNFLGDGLRDALDPKMRKD